MGYTLDSWLLSFSPAPFSPYGLFHQGEGFRLLHCAISPGTFAGIFLTHQLPTFPRHRLLHDLSLQARLSSLSPISVSCPLPTPPLILSGGVHYRAHAYRDRYHTPSNGRDKESHEIGALFLCYLLPPVPRPS